MIERLREMLARVLAFAEERGWRRLQLLSSAGNSFRRDYHGETAAGDQRPMLNVFHRDAGGIRHFWSSELMFAPTDDPGHRVMRWVFTVNGQVHRVPVDHRQGARHPQADGTDARVRLVSQAGRRRGRAGTEHLGLRRQLDVHLEADDRFVPTVVCRFQPRIAAQVDTPP
jgi:hypothetical protein